MKIRGAKESELEELIGLQQLVFRPDEPDAQQRYWAYVREDPTYRLHQSRVVVNEGRIVSHLRVLDRKIRVRGGKLRVGGIASVLTHPDFRGRGYAKALMQETARYLYDKGYEIGLLFTAIGTPFYASLGWTSIPLATFQLRIGDAKRVEPAANVCRPILVEDVEVVHRIYRQSCRGMTGPEVRSKLYWLSGSSRWRGVFPTWVALRNDKVVAYVNVEIEKGRVWMKEACALAGEETAYIDLARQVVHLARESRAWMVEGILPKDHGFADALAVFGETSWGLHDKMMVKLANWNTLVHKLGGSELPVRPSSEGAFWRTLFGLRKARKEDEFGTWIRTLPDCVGPCYWASDMF